MDFIGILSVVVMPWVVSTLTTRIKQVGPIPSLPYRVAIIRAIVALLALGGAVLSLWVGDATTIDGALVETAALTVFNALVATWIYVVKKP